jgi:enoyl-CoA hydratase/carnithine racemase
MSFSLRTPTVLVDDAESGVRRLILNRPDALNALSWSVLAGVRDALDDALDNDSIRCVSITGAGRAFSAGSDVSGGAQDLDGPDPWDTFAARLEDFPKPLVAAVNGLAVGLGATILGHCDLVLAGTEARFRFPFTSLGLVPEVGSTSWLPHVLGPQRAAHALLTSSWISAEDAAASGLVWRLVADAHLQDETAAVCDEIAAQPLAALVATKRLLLDARMPEIHGARMREEPAFRRLLEGPAYAEALAAFHERRAPDFSKVG